MEIQTLQEEFHKIAKEKGWWKDGERNIPELLCLVHSEISEALEEHRNGHNIKDIYYSTEGKPEGFPVELADVIIRILDMSEYYGINMEEVLLEKLKYNKTRPYRHGGKVC